MNIVDEAIGAPECQRLRTYRIHFRQIGAGIGRTGMKDREDILPLLHRLKRPTFFTLDHGFYHPMLLHQGYWSTTKVTPQVLRASLWELRHALGDTTEQPCFIETVSQQGWRFVAPVAPAPLVASSQHSVASRKPAASGPQLTTNN